MIIMRRSAGIALSLFLVCCPSQAGAAAYAKMIDLKGNPVGRARLMSVSHGVLIEIEVKGLAPGAHAIMVHGAGICDATKSFATAGSDVSFDPQRRHGYLVKDGPRTGDLPSQYAGADGLLHAATITTAFTLGNGKKSILDGDGAAIIVYARGDDYLTQPDGNAGPRVACGVIRRAGEPH
jgi:Cu-Zn family superoxide dismutase